MSIIYVCGNVFVPLTVFVDFEKCHIAIIRIVSCIVFDMILLPIAVQHSHIVMQEPSELLHCSC